MPGYLFRPASPLTAHNFARNYPRCLWPRIGVMTLEWLFAHAVPSPELTRLYAIYRASDLRLAVNLP